MKIQLDYEIKIEVRENNKVKEKLVVFYREFTQAEKKEHEAVKAKFQKIFKKAQKIGKKQVQLEKKSELYELDRDYKKSLEYIDKKESLDDDIDALQDELDELGGGNQDEFTEKTAKERFIALVSGKDKDKLEQLAKVKGYASLIRDLDIAKAELEKKQSGE